ncbi:mediator complex, subunit Med21 [Amylocarpus encephaloides]|uniref:Mediator of RNA polymerase II transcription subunit 21 n=1 Tax=Amylocarpus encephaloides TaxID=45428 RepID=A0A9P8C9G5_9HELO|nr:mediator complex, subunit Med21 [Amylocarpus encephaloides]
MADRLTQLQDAVDQLGTQFVASIHFVNNRHDLQKLSQKDIIREKDETKQDPIEVNPLPPDEFKAGQRELAQDLILKEQQIEFLISVLPGLENSEKDQEEMIKQLEADLKVAEEQRKQALKDKAEILTTLEGVIRQIIRP